MRKPHDLTFGEPQQVNFELVTCSRPYKVTENRVTGFPSEENTLITKVSVSGMSRDESSSSYSIDISSDTPGLCTCASVNTSTSAVCSSKPRFQNPLKRRDRGLCLLNGMLTSEFVRKTQLEADQVAGEQIQRTLHPQKVEELLGYQVEMFYKPLRGVGGDYFDVIELPDGRTLFAVADVSGKGMPAALLAANIQALVRSISNVASDPLSLAQQVNNHLCRYTPPERFATAIFALLSRETGELKYVNAWLTPLSKDQPGTVRRLGRTGRRKLNWDSTSTADWSCKRILDHYR